MLRIYLPSSTDLKLWAQAPLDQASLAQAPLAHASLAQAPLAQAPMAQAQMVDPFVSGPFGPGPFDSQPYTIKPCYENFLTFFGQVHTQNPHFQKLCNQYFISKDMLDVLHKLGNFMQKKFHL